VVVAGRNLLGVPLAQAAAVQHSALTADLDDCCDGGDSDSENEEGRLGVGPELWAGAEWHPSRWFSVNLGAAYFYWHVYGLGVHVVSPRAGLRFSL
jgi:hypothetical protein